MAFFSAVDMDTVLRKEVDMDCVTPSNSNPIAAGESLTIERLLEKTSDQGLGQEIESVKAEIAQLRAELDSSEASLGPKNTAKLWPILDTLEAQLCENQEEMWMLMRKNKESNKHCFK